MELAAYLDRIGFSGPARADRETLFAVHRAHLLAVAYENIDVFLRRPVTRTPQDAYAKIVTAKRGGWCYEMNGLLGWALEEIGFPVLRMAGGVRRAIFGDSQTGNHLVLLVELDQPWLCDAGFGDGLLDPVPLKEGAHDQHGFVFRLEKLDAAWWRFHNHQFGSAPSFDFARAPADPALLEQQCRLLQGDDSRFVNTLVCQRHTPNGLVTLRGRTLKRINPEGVAAREIDSEAEFVRVLRDEFALELEDALLVSTWERVSSQG